METIKSQKRKNESVHTVKVDGGASNKRAGRNKNTYLIIACPANREAMKNTTVQTNGSTEIS